MPRRVLVAALGCLAILALPAVAAARVLRVGSYKGIRGQYKTPGSTSKTDIPATAFAPTRKKAGDR